MFFIPAIVAANVLAAQYERDAFEAALESMPQEMRQAAREKREKAINEATQDRRHREMVDAIRSNSNGMSSFLIGFITGRF